MGLLITSATSLPIQQTSSQEDEIRAEFISVQRQPMLKTKSVDNSVQPSFYGVPVTGGDFDEFHPSVAGSPAGGPRSSAGWRRRGGPGSTWRPPAGSSTGRRAPSTWPAIP